MMKYCKKNLILVVVLSTFLGVTGCGNTQTTAKQASTQVNNQQKRTITDSAGKQVEIPINIQRIADAWPAHNEVLAMLGEGNKIVATAHTPESKPWLYKVNPAMNKAVNTFTPNINIEELIKTKPDIAIMPLADKAIDKISEVGIPVVQLDFKDFNGLKSCFLLTGDILGDVAKQKAQLYVNYLDSKLKMVTDVTSKIPLENRPKVLHLTSLSPNIADGGNTIVDAWIQTAGGVNAASEVTGNGKEVSMEQILKWNPDVIILGTLFTSPNAKNADLLKTDPRWQKIKAVMNGRVYVNPIGAFMWDRYGAEEALQIQWAAKTLNPDKFADVDMNQITKDFYKTFFSYNLTEDETNRILTGQNPAQ
ncbi:ABC-type transporter, periplasmic subunit [Candidatus Desulfosporosinus infrequens]|uniref:ABC-type transporter, periplasmic subunit n=1 Tax=Candidatus Desulfosporosinus infrequens TaxID=2043169 RepID=A0A2U3JX22_9FIRM|nr:ABC-type transporter, periplasmic subunit [Candidatus Desulfosporosinus infrequens]